MKGGHKGPFDSIGKFLIYSREGPHAPSLVNMLAVVYVYRDVGFKVRGQGSRFRSFGAGV